ncbi:MAG: TetR/AcrR family transcriptional regulator [Bacteroidales bacterium]
MSKRKQILDTTINLVSEMGLHATPMSLIIKESNVAAGTIYHYFKSKDKLINTLYSELHEEMGNAIIQNINHELNYKDKFFLIWKNLFLFYKTHPRKFEFLEHYESSPLIKNEIKEINQRHYQPAIDFFKTGIQLGVLRNLPVALMINLIFSNVSTLIRMVLMDEIEYTDQLLKETIQSSWDSIKIN